MLLRLLLICSIALGSTSLATAEMTVHFIDVGQGGGVLIEKGGKHILYDCGDTFAGPIVRDYLSALDIDSIDVMIISHAHKDHMGGCIEILEHMPVKIVYHNGSKTRTGVWKKFQKAAKKAQTIQVIEQDGDLDGFTILVGYDSRAKRFSKEADNSLLVRLTDGNVRVLLTGDCEATCEKEVSGTSDVRSEILNVGHHGSNAASSPAFLSKVKPKIAIAQAGLHNQYGHPTTAVRNRLKQAGIQLYRTDFAGSVVLHSDGETYEVETEK